MALQFFRRIVRNTFLVFAGFLLLPLEKMEDEFRLFVFIHQQVLVISMLWEAYALGSGKTT